MYYNPHGIKINILFSVYRATGDRRPVLQEEKRGPKYDLTLSVNSQFLWEVFWEKSSLIIFMKVSLT